MRVLLASLLIAATPQFTVPPELPEARAGGMYSHHFCTPWLTRGRCGGRTASGQRNPRGGAGGPYVFWVEQGSLPPGLAVGRRTGSIGGRVDEAAELRRYDFHVCATDASGATCRRTSIVVEAAVPSFAGSWEGTYSYTSNPCGLAVTGAARLVTFDNPGPSFAYYVRFTLNGFDARTDASCALVSREDSVFTRYFAHQTPDTIRVLREVLALTLESPNTITGIWLTSAYGLVELTLTRSRAVASAAWP